MQSDAIDHEIADALMKASESDAALLDSIDAVVAVRVVLLADGTVVTHTVCRDEAHSALEVENLATAIAEAVYAQIEPSDVTDVH